jgi:hypothetical protein
MLFAERGYATTTIEAISESSGTPQATRYRLFGVALHLRGTPRARSSLGGQLMSQRMPGHQRRVQPALGAAVDAAGNIAIADTNIGSTRFDMGNNRVRVVAAATGTFYGVPMTAGDIYTVAGNGTPGFSGDGRAAVRAELGKPFGVDEPFGVGVDAAGDLLIADLFDGRVRQVSG